MDLLIQAIEAEIPTPDRDPDTDPRMHVARSFDINKPGRAPPTSPAAFSVEA